MSTSAANTRPEPLAASDLDTALAILLAPPGRNRPAERSQVRSFREYLGDGRLHWVGARIGLMPAPRALFLSVLIPGRTAIVLAPTPGELGIERAAQQALTAEQVHGLGERHLHFAQALLPPEAREQRNLLLAAGFRFLAPLRYLERDVRYPWVEPPNLDPSAWVAFSEQTQSGFARTLLATYERSRDCPELTGLRPIEDVLAGHRAAGVFEPGLWELLRLDGEPAGCMLLSALRDGASAEVVYMGVVPLRRGQRVGELLLRRALEHCRGRGLRRLTLAADARNAPALKLYERFGFRPVAQRAVYLRRWAAVV